MQIDSSLNNPGQKTPFESHWKTLLTGQAVYLCPFTVFYFSSSVQTPSPCEIAGGPISICSDRYHSETLLWSHTKIYCTTNTTYIKFCPCLDRMNSKWRELESKKYFHRAFCYTCKHLLFLLIILLFVGVLLLHW